jgi:aminoglycoside phosphotransferase (APT) family kinase protein
MPWRFDVSDDDLRQYLPAVLADVGVIASYKRLEGGTYNTGVVVRLENGGDVIVKISPPSSAPGLTYESELLATEADYFRRTRPLGVPVPEVLAIGTEVIPGRHHLVMSMLPGRTWWGFDPAPSDAARGAVRRQLGRPVAQAHEAPCDGFGYMFGREQLRGETWPDAFERMMGALLDDAAAFATDLPVPVAEIRELVAVHRRALSDVVDPVLVHFDLWDGNILVSEDQSGPIITGIIDGERALYGDPVFEFPSLSVFSDRTKDPSFVIDEDFLIGYSEIRGPLDLTTSLLVRLALYRTYLYMVMLIEVTPREMTGDQKSWRQTEVFDIVSHQLRYLREQLQ